MASEENKRTVFISCSALYNFYRQVDATEMENAIFMFGSKRCWLFPETEAERSDSAQQPTDYLQMSDHFKQLVLKKEAENLVFWLKPDDYEYSGDISDGDPESYQRFSTWIQTVVDPVTNENYGPLILDDEWWLSKETFPTPKYCYARQAIIDNYKSGAHSYRPVMELVYQSNPTMVPKRLMSTTNSHSVYTAPWKRNKKTSHRNNVAFASLKS